MCFIFWVPFKAFSGCGWKALDLPLFILNKSDSSPHLKNLYSHLHWGLLDVNMSLCIAFLSAQASEFESFWTGSNMRQLWQAVRPLITVNYLSGREAPKPPEQCSPRACSTLGRGLVVVVVGVCAHVFSNQRATLSGRTCVFSCICALASSAPIRHVAPQVFAMLTERQSCSPASLKKQARVCQTCHTRTHQRALEERVFDEAEAI